MIVLTQEPLNFTGPFRLNADPHTENTSVQIMGALERLGLWRVIHGELDMNLSRLDAVMSVNFLSHGQHQQFCLARAL
jgi:ABC-type multidrug transport system fused ATPase/permease subunit